MLKTSLSDDSEQVIGLSTKKSVNQFFQTQVNTFEKFQNDNT